MFVITVLCPSCGEFTEIPLARIEVLTDGDYLGSCEKCDVSIKCHLTPQKKKTDISIEDIVLEKAKKGQIVFSTYEGFMSADIDEFIKQPADGILYDLNRLPEVVIKFIDDPKWVNDFAVGLVIKRLKEKCAGKL